MNGGAAGGLLRHQQWSASLPPSWILPRISLIRLKQREMVIA